MYERRIPPLLDFNWNERNNYACTVCRDRVR